MKRRYSAANVLGGALIILAGWAALSLIVDRAILPPPWEVAPVFVDEIRADLGAHTLISAGRVLAATALAVIGAVPAGLALGQIRALDRWLGPVIALLHPIPKIAFLPVILLLAGAGDLSKILLIALILFFQILVVVRDEAAGLSPELIASVRSLGAGRRALFRFVYIPASIPAVLTALRVGVGTAVAVLFIAETYATRSGLGYYIITETWGALRYREMYAGILAVSGLGLVLTLAIDTLDARFSYKRKALS